MKNGNEKSKQNLKKSVVLQTLPPKERDSELMQNIKGNKSKSYIVHKNKTIKDVAKLVLSTELSPETAKKYLGDYVSDEKDQKYTIDTLMSFALAREVIENGNAKAYEVLRDTAGYSPKTELTLNGNLDVLTSSDRAILAKMREKLPNFSQNDEETES